MISTVVDSERTCTCFYSHLLVTPLFHCRGDAKNGKEERHYNFWALIFWDNVRKLKLKMAVVEGIDMPVVPMKIVSFRKRFQRWSYGECLGHLRRMHCRDGSWILGPGSHTRHMRSKRPKKDTAIIWMRLR